MFLFPGITTRQAPSRLLACPHCPRSLNIREHGYHCPACGKNYKHSELMRAYSTLAGENYQSKVNKPFQELQADAWKRALRG